MENKDFTLEEALERLYHTTFFDQSIPRKEAYKKLKEFLSSINKNNQNKEGEKLK